MDTVVMWTVVLGSVLFVAEPFLRKKVAANARASAENGRLGHLHAKRDNLVAVIKDLEFDREMGKVSDEDFAQLAARYRSDAMSVLKQIDSLERGNGVLESSRGESASLDAGLQKSATTACAACGEEADPEDRFCSQCGKPLSLNRS